MMRHGSLFSGIGGFDLAAEWMGWTNVFHCEINPFCRQVLHHYWPEAESFTDVKNSNFQKYEGSIDIISGGFPCQPYSVAGKRLGKEDDRHLWPYMLDAIRAIKPRYVVGENVRGLVNWNDGMVFEEVHTDLEAEGYEVQAFILPAAGVNAPHRRDRIWFIAYANHQRGSSGLGQVQGENGEISKRNDNDKPCDTSIGIATNANCNDGRSANRCSGCEESEAIGKRKQSVYSWFGATSNEGNATNASNQGLQRCADNGGAGGCGKERDKQPTGCLRNTWENFPTESPVCGRDDGLPSRLDGIAFSKWRNESVKAYGNAVVPQVVYEIFKAIEACDRI